MRYEMVERPKIDYTEENIKLALEIYKKTKDVLDFLLYIQENRNTKLSLILIETDAPGFLDILNRKKRKTDMVFKIDENKGIYMLIAQETDSEGGYIFLERLFSEFKDNENLCSFASLIEVVDVHNHPQRKNIIFHLLDNFLNISSQPRKWKKCQIAIKKL